MLGDVAVHLLIQHAWMNEQCSSVGNTASTAMQQPHAICIDDRLRMDDWGVIYMSFLLSVKLFAFYV